MRRVEVRYRDPTQMGKVYLAPEGVDRPIPGLDATLGPDADDPGLTLPVWQARIKRHPGELKNLLKNQEFIAGIGNAYSDEILHAAGLLPFRKRSTLAPEEVAALHAATARPCPERSASSGSASRRPSRPRSGTSWRSTTRAASPARAAGRGSARSAPAAS